jgi:hypothetical protein
MNRHTSARPSGEQLEAREVPALGLDPTFGTGGRVVVTENGTWTTGGLAIQADGKIVVGGHVHPAFSGQSSGANTELTVLRFNANGTPDTSFGTAGRSATTYGSLLFAYTNDMALLSDGRIVLGGSSTYGHGLLAWFGSSGTVLSQEQFSGADGGLSYITRVLAMPQGGVMAIAGAEFEYHAAPGVMEDVIQVHAGPGFVPSAVALGSGGELVVAGVSIVTNWPFGTSAGGAPGAYRLADPGVTASKNTFVVWTTPREVPEGAITLTAGVLPILGPSEITEGTITIREGSTVLGTIRAGTLSELPWVPPGAYSPVGINITLTPGDHTLTAEYSGTSRWAPSSSTTAFHVADTVDVTATLAVSNATPKVGESVVLTATLTTDGGGTLPPGSIVSFYDGDTIVGISIGPVNGVATAGRSTLAPGPHSIRAVYCG